LLQAEEITDAKAETVAKALVDFCDKLPPTDRGTFFQDEVSYGSSLFERMIGGLCSPTRPDGGSPAFQLVKRFLEETDGLYVPITFCEELVHNLNRQIGRSLFDTTREQVTELGTLIAAKIERRADGDFFNHPRVSNLLFFCGRFGDKGRLRERLASGIDNPTHLSRLLEVIAEKRESVMGKKNPYLDEIADFISVDLLERKVATINEHSLTDYERSLIEAFRGWLKDSFRSSMPSG
jgi:hypothetical protein